MEVVVEELRKVTGYDYGALDFVDGELHILDKNMFSGGSETAREVLVAYLEDNRTVEFLAARNRSRKDRLNMAAAGSPSPGAFRRYILVDFEDFASEKGIEVVLNRRGKDIERTVNQKIREDLRFSLGIGLTLFHELTHSFLDVVDPKTPQQIEAMGVTGPTVDVVNEMRRELNIPVRMFYKAISMSSDPLNSNFGRGRIHFSLGGKRIGSLIISEFHNAPEGFKGILQGLISNPNASTYLKNRAQARLNQLNNQE